MVLQTKIEKLEEAWAHVERQVCELESEAAKTKRLVELYREGQLIPFSSLAEAEIEKPFVLAPGVRCYRLPTQHPSQLLFVVEFEPQAKLRNHFHDCAEQVSIMRGELYDFVANKRYRREFSYPSLQKHELYSAEGCLCTVRFQLSAHGRD